MMRGPRRLGVLEILTCLAGARMVVIFYHRNSMWFNMSSKVSTDISTLNFLMASPNKPIAIGLFAISDIMEVRPIPEYG